MNHSLARPEVSQFVAGNVAGILFGIFLALASMSFYILMRGIRYEPTRRRVNSFLLISLAIIACMITANYVLDTSRTATALLDIPTGPGQAKYLTNLLSDKYAALNTLLTMVVLVGDMVLAWRCWSVWRDWRVVVAPTIFIIGGIVSGATGVYRGRHARQTDIVYLSSLKAWSHAFVACSLAANIYTTSFIVGRLWYLDRQAHNLIGHTGGAIRRAAIIVVESGALNAATMLSYEVALGVKSNVFHIFAVCALYAVGISFALIVIRVAMHGTTPSDFQRTVTNTHLDFARPSTIRSARQQQGDGDDLEKGQKTSRVDIVSLDESGAEGSRSSEMVFDPRSVHQRV